MLIRKKELLVAVGMVAVLLCGCGSRANVPVAEEGPMQQGKKQMGAYVTIEEEEVPLAADLQIMTEAGSETNMQTGSEGNAQASSASKAEVAQAPKTEVAQAPEAVATETPEAEVTMVSEAAALQQAVPTQEVEVFLQAEDTRMDVVVETEKEPVPQETVAETTFDAPAFSAEVQQAVNDTRAAAGLSKLTVTPELSKAAAQRAAEIASSFSHTRPGGIDYSTAVTEAGGSFGSIGENLFCGMQSVTAIQNAWNGSEIHLDNILNAEFAHIGIGVAETPDGVYVVQIFTD